MEADIEEKVQLLLEMPHASYACALTIPKGLEGQEREAALWRAMTNQTKQTALKVWLTDEP